MNIKKLSDRKRRYLFRLLETETDKEIIARCDATLEDALKKFSVRNSVAPCLCAHELTFLFAAGVVP